MYELEQVKNQSHDDLGDVNQVAQGVMIKEKTV
jgi:hypothetical protein